MKFPKNRVEIHHSFWRVYRPVSSDTQHNQYRLSTQFPEPENQQPSAIKLQQQQEDNFGTNARETEEKAETRGRDKDSMEARLDA